METKQVQSTATLKTKHLAAELGMRQQALRRVLRNMPEYADGVHTNYRWDPDKDKAKLDRIRQAVKKAAEDKAKRAAEAKAKLEEKAKADKEQAKLDKASK